MRRNWTSDDLTSFRRDFKNGDMSIEDMSAKYGRSVKALREKACIMKMARPGNKGRMRPWTDDELRMVREMRARGCTISTIASRTNRSRDSVSKKLGTTDETDVSSYWRVHRDAHRKAGEQFAAAMNGHRFDDMPVKRAPLLSNMRLARVREVGA